MVSKIEVPRAQVNGLLLLREGNKENLQEVQEIAPGPDH